MKYLVANWKSHKTLVEAKEWLRQFSIFNFQFSNLEVILAASFIHLPVLQESMIQNSQFIIHLASQDISPFPAGAYTGEVSAAMLRNLVDYVMIGHSERREYFGETEEIVAKKTDQALQAGLKPIICLDEPYLESQIAKLPSPSADGLIFAYEPIEALKLDKLATPAQAARIAKKIKNLAPEAVVLYGGAVDSTTAADYQQLDGLLIGQASLDASEFKKIIQSLSS